LPKDVCEGSMTHHWNPYGNRPAKLRQANLIKEESLNEGGSADQVA
jgi:hypothetical protein